MAQNNQFTEGKIFGPLIKFALPVFFALCLQSLYGAVDLLIVGHFGSAADVSAVSTGSQIMHMITVVITGMAMGTTIMLGHAIGCGKKDEAGTIIGAFGIRIPVSYFMSKIENVSLFGIGLATPASTIVQIILCVIFLRYTVKKEKALTR